MPDALANVDMEALLNALRRQEVSTDRYDPNAPLLAPKDQVSGKGALGEMQIVPGAAMDPGYGIPNIFDTARAMGFDPVREDNATAGILAMDPLIAREYARGFITGATRELGSVDRAIGAYNRGISGMKEAEGSFDRLPAETQGYVVGVPRWYRDQTGENLPMSMSPRPRPRPQVKGLLG